MPGEFKPFKWVDKVIGETHDPQKLCEPVMLPLPKAAIYSCNDDMTFWQEVISKIKQTPKNPSAGSNKQLIDKYQELCSKPSSVEFQSLIAQQKDQLEQLVILDNAYNAKYKQLREKTYSIYSSQHPLSIRGKEDDFKLRKKSWWANVRYHFDTVDQKPLFSKSMLICTGLGLSIPVMMIGGIVLIATLGTYLFPLSIAFFALGGVLGLVGAITALVDKCQAESAFKKFPQEKAAAIEEIKQIKRELLDIALSMQKVTFEPEAPGQHLSPIASPVESPKNQILTIGSLMSLKSDL